jgi:peptidoglycan LD-endopeptidase LytH
VRFRFRYGYPLSLVKRRTALLVVALVLATAVLPASAESDLDDARRDANRAAAALAAAETRLSELETGIADLEREIASAEDRLTMLSAAVQQEAVRRYIDGGRGAVPILEQNDLNAGVRADALARFATSTADSHMDSYRAARLDADDAKAELEARKGEAVEAAAELKRARDAAYAELARQQEHERQRIEAERKAREEAERRARAEADRRAAAASRPAAAPARASAPAAPARVIGSGAWICPVQGPRSFSNDYGMPRSGGRRHQGNDILSPRGTPVVAPVAGSVTHRSVGLGGLSFFLNGVDGNEYFGTHLSGYAAGGQVSAGTVIGYVGDTGNARGTPHLHFEIHPGGGGPINPYPTLSQYC